ncbi:MAG: response regulator transcription factor [Anaerolineales bacterium]|nr:response regulator transcription factor [Anaerolineales bacterium]
MNRIRIVLADDHPVVRHGVRGLLQAEPEFVVVGEATDGLETVQLVEKLQPEVLVVDLMIPGVNGLEVIRQIRQRLPLIRIVVLSMHANEPYVLEALRNGAAGYVLKDSSAGDLVLAVRQVLAGQRYLSPPLSERAVEAYLQRSRETSFDPYDALTEREREVLHLAAEGLSNPDVAARLSISPRTVETHRANLMRKLGLKTQTDLIRYALKRGILPMEG